MKLTSYFTPICVLALSGCITPYQTNFDCPVPNGVPCTSMTKINRMIDKGLLGKPDRDVKNTDCDCESSTQDSDEENKKVYITHFKPEAEPKEIPEESIGDAPAPLTSCTITSDQSACLGEQPIVYQTEEQSSLYELEGVEDHSEIAENNTEATHIDLLPDNTDESPYEYLQSFTPTIESKTDGDNNLIPEGLEDNNPATPLSETFETAYPLKEENNAQDAA